MSGYHRYQSRYCSHAYDERLGDPDCGIAPGTRFDDIPDDWMCTESGPAKSDYALCEV